MGKKFENSLESAAIQGRRARGVVGSSKTNQQIREQSRRIAKAIAESGFSNLKEAAQLRERHIRQAFEKLSQNHSKRTLQNYARSLRYILQGVQKTDLLQKLTNRELGTSGSCRDGTKTAITQEKFCQVKAAAAALPDPRRREALAVILDVSRFGGLRLQESRMVGQQANRHLQSLDNRGVLCLRAGTKGGRYREVRIAPANIPALRAALVEAARIAGDHGGQLWPGATGRASQANLSKYCSIVGLVGSQSHHSLRYAFARDQLDFYQSQGFSFREALSQVSLDLGHGEGRIDYVKQVYLK